MPTTTKSRVEHVDGVHCSFNFASRLVIVGTGLVGHDQRDQFKLKSNSTLEAQVRARPKFMELAAAAATAAKTSELPFEPQQPPPEPPTESQ